MEYWEKEKQPHVQEIGSTETNRSFANSNRFDKVGT